MFHAPTSDASQVSPRNDVVKVDESGRGQRPGRAAAGQEVESSAVISSQPRAQITAQLSLQPDQTPTFIQAFFRLFDETFR